MCSAVFRSVLWRRRRLNVRTRTRRLYPPLPIRPPPQSVVVPCSWPWQRLAKNSVFNTCHLRDYRSPCTYIRIHARTQRIPLVCTSPPPQHCYNNINFYIHVEICILLLFFFPSNIFLYAASPHPLLALLQYIVYKVIRRVRTVRIIIIIILLLYTCRGHDKHATSCACEHRHRSSVNKMTCETGPVKLPTAPFRSI